MFWCSHFRVLHVWYDKRERARPFILTYINAACMHRSRLKTIYYLLLKLHILCTSHCFFCCCKFCKISIYLLRIVFFKSEEKFRQNACKWPTKLNLLSQKLFCLLEIYACFNVQIRTYLSKVFLSQFIFIAKLKLTMNWST